MRIIQFLFLLVCLSVGAHPAGAAIRWDSVFLETSFANSLATNAATNPVSLAMPSGGNAWFYPDPAGTLPSATYTNAGQVHAVQLRQSVIGHAVAVAPEIVSSMLTRSFSDLQSGVGYTSLASETADHARNDGQPWNIRFPGVVDPVNTNNSGFTFTDANFFPDRTTVAADYYRAALRAEPFNITAANGLLRTYYERMAAYTYAGHNGAERAARVRLLFGDINTEINNLEVYTLKFYTNATDELNLLTARSLEAQLLDGSYPHLPVPALATNRNRIAEAYTRALTHQGETVFKLGRLKQFNNYRNPVIDQTAFQTIANLQGELTARRQAVTERQLLLGVFPEMTLVAKVELGKGNYFLDQIQLLERSIENGRIAFVAARDTGSGTPTQPDIQYVFREYDPDFVPFHALTSVGGVTKRAHEQFLDIATSFLSGAAQREVDAANQSRDFDVSSFAQQQSLTELTNRYFGELGTLCGRIQAAGGQLAPDVVLALYPRTERLALYSYSGSGESLGEIGAQWLRIEQARTEVEIAEQDLDSLYSQMEKKSEVAGQIVGGIDNLARMFFQNGERLEGLDVAAGNLQANAIIERARAQQGNSFWNGFKRAVTVAAAVVATVYSGGTASPLLAGAVATVGVADAYANDAKGMKASKIEARLARNLAKINAQRTRIATLEKVAVQYQQRDQVLLQTEEALHSLLLQAERQKLTILLAEQRFDSELLSLQNLMSRVQYLLQEYAGALALQERNPLSSPDYRLIRNIRMREAEDSFHLAHRWVYLAAKSVEYRVNTASESSLLPNTISVILRSRNASALESAMATLNNTLNGFYEDQNREISGLTPNYISFRNHIIQRNVLTNDQNISIAELQPDGLSSSQAWLQFLQSKTATNSSGTRQKLIIPLSTSLNRWPQSPDPKFRNPLFANDTHNDALSGIGIEVQISGTGINMAGLVARFRLEYAGASAMRQETCALTGGKTVRYWNIRRPDGSPYLAEGVPGIASTSSWGTGAIGFNEFSPANDRWNLIMDGTSGQGAAGNAQLLTQLEQVTDIRIRFWTSYFPSGFCP